MDETFEKVITEQLIFIGVVYVFLFAFLKLKNFLKKHLYVQKFTLFVLGGMGMFLAYYIFLCNTFISASILVLLLGSVIYFMWGIGFLMISHLIAFFLMPFLGMYRDGFTGLILIVLFSLLIMFAFDKSQMPMSVKAVLICGIPLTMYNLVYFWGDMIRLLYMCTICFIMIKIAVIDGCKVIEDFNRYQVSYDQCIIDPLTGLYNRRKIDLLHGVKENISILIIDIDDFKYVNDKYGHIAGDLCLKEIAKIILSSCAPEEEIPLRFGGDEFMIFCFNKSPEHTAQLAEIIRDKISRYPFIYNQSSIRVTVSIGIKNFDENVEVDKLIREADIAMYCSKNTGKNTITAT